MNIIGISIYIFSVFISAVSQIILKTSADKEYKNKLYEYLNIRVIIAYGIFFLATLFTVFAYSNGVDLSMGMILETTGYLWVTLLGYFILKEKVNSRKLTGLLVIVVGILVSCLF